jgi:hypothetical protein
MKTNQIMIRTEAFAQRTSDGYFNATMLLSSWNIQSKAKPLQMGKYKVNKSTNDFIDQLKKEGIQKPMITGRGTGLNAGTWMHPKLFIDFAMWVSVEFKSIVIDYVLDGLIFNRNSAGDYYNQMCATILKTHVDYYGTKPNPTIYITEATRIKALLGLSNKDRNKMTEKELAAITQMQKTNSLLLVQRKGKTARIKQLEFQAKLLKL